MRSKASRARKRHDQYLEQAYDPPVARLSTFPRRMIRGELRVTSRLVVSAVGLWLGACTPEAFAPSEAAMRLRFINNSAIPFPIPISTSPDGKMLLYKDFDSSSFSLGITRWPQLKDVLRHRSLNRHLAPAWSPSGDRVAYLADSLGNSLYQLHILDVESVKNIAIPFAVAGTLGLAWSPNGERIAYLSGFGQSLDAMTVSSTGARLPTLLARGVERNTGFAWSPEGHALALVRNDPSRRLVLVDANDGSDIWSMPLDMIVREIVWPRGCQCILFTGRDGTDEFFQLHRLDLQNLSVEGVTGAASRVTAAVGDVVGLQVLGTTTVAFQISANGLVRTVISAPSKTDIEANIRRWDGNVFVVGTGSRNQELVGTRITRDQSPKVVRVNLDDFVVGNVDWPMSKVPTTGRPPETVSIPTSDGATANGYLWKPDGSPMVGLLILVHGGPAAHYSAAWDAAIQGVLAERFAVLALNYRGSTGFGATYEAAGQQLGLQIYDLRGAIGFARRKLKLDSRKIVVIGHSYGALIVAEAAAVQPAVIQRAVLISLPTERIRELERKKCPRIVMFHGRQDALLSAEDAKAAVSSAFGNSTCRPLSRFAILENEGHDVRTLGSWASIYAAALSLVHP